ncbi:hypothetical protein HUN01_34045 [Nostoc edaphicum CCNP1411]|uniref:Uncharacterized protein n=1 Tax=Nostoc edaphicum CCNP1411 TaxID=1472755 RepID=A0A7D7LI26_9NOSO|nr:hypothetical protein [Nostoc edaphicum]QMS92370.1 hypothetical protein HUN01_34045 [Nostoc edaphicum CCNP1411]
MQIIQSPLGNNIHPLGIISSLSNSHRMLLRKESHSLNLRSNFISPIQTKPALVTSSKFFLSREHEPSIQPLIGWDTQDINSEFSLLKLDSSDSITPPGNSNETTKDSIPEIMPTRIEKNTGNDASSEINLKGKSKSKKTNKSQQPPEKKSKPKSKTKKTVKSSVAKNVEKLIDKSNVPISFNENSLLASDEPLSIKPNSELDPLQLDIASEHTTTSNNSVNSITTSTSPNIEDKSISLKNITNESQQLNSELPYSSPSAESSVTESILISPEEINLDDTISETEDTSPLEFTLPNNLEQTVVPYINFRDNEQQIITEASESVNISDIPVSPTPPQQDIKYQVPSIVDNQSTTSQTNLIQKKEVSPTVNSSSQPEESPHTNRNFEAIPAIEPDLISESAAKDFVKDNAVADNFLENAALSSKVTPIDVDDIVHSLANDENIVGTDSFALKADVALPNSESSAALSSAFTSPEVDDVPTLVHTLANDENIIGADSFAPKVDVTLPISESSVVKIPITLQQEIDSSVTSEPQVSAPVELTPTSANIGDTPSLFRNSDSNEQLVTSESKSAISVNVSDVSENMNSLEHDSNIENTTSESTENLPILALPEINETERIIATSPEIVETPVVNATSSEIVETQVVNATSPEIVETQVVNATSPEIVETPVVNATSPEVAEAPVVNATSPEIAETESIFREIIDNEQPVESEFPFAVTNPEISTFVDTSDNPDIPEEPTSSQNEVSTVPKVEQNTTVENLPAPKGYATGGHVTDSHVENRQQIAPSDTVPAMLTPGEFVINTRDAQKNLPLLHHINTGGTPQDIILPSLQTPNFKEPEETTSPETPTKVDSFPDTSLQLKSAETNSSQISNPFTPASLGLDIGKQKLSILNSPQLNLLQNQAIDVGETSPQYSSPPLIFRKANSSINTSAQWSNTPSQWSSVEDLLNENNDEFTSFNFNDGESNSKNSEFSHVSESPQIFAKHIPTFRGFADGGEVTPPDISREIEPITETIESISSSSEEGDKDDTANLEALAREIYSRLRQRIEIERERHGGYSGRLPW